MVVQIIAYLLLYRDARLGRAQGVSAQTCVALSMSVTVGVLNLSRRYWWTSFLGVLMTAGVGWACSWAVKKSTDVGKEEDEIVTYQKIPLWARRAALYAFPAAMAILAVLVANKFSFEDMSSKWSPKDPKNAVAVDAVASYQNFLHGFALLPQLVLSQRRGIVAPAAGKFLVITGPKHIFEFVADMSISYENWQRGRLQMREFSFMSGDIFAAIVLLDLFYMYAKTLAKSKMPAYLGAACFALEV
jgi:hypothetical protein